MPLIFGVTSGGVLVPVLLESDGSLPIAQKGWIGAAWRKNPLQFGFSGLVVETVEDIDLDEGGNSLNTTAVPAGEIHVLTNIAFRFTGTVPTRVRISIINSGTAYNLFDQVAPVTQTLYDRQGWWILAEGDLIRCTITGATAGDDLFLYISGFRIDVDQ